jgi:hypothetical protein
MPQKKKKSKCCAVLHFMRVAKQKQEKEEKEKEKKKINTTGIRRVAKSDLFKFI